MTRLSLAEEFLREAVYRSRERQSPVRDPSCGLGGKAEVVLDLSPRAREIHGLLSLGNVHGVMSDWIERQDAIDRKRNHFLKAFRGQHGFDRKLYAPETLAEFEAGLARINGEEDSERRAAAERLLA